MNQAGQELEEDLSHHIRLLLEPGESNKYLQQEIPDNPVFSQNYNISVEEECKLDEIPFEEDLTYPEELSINDAKYFIVDTKPGPAQPERGWIDGRKGHEVRNMVVWYEHGEIPPVSETYVDGKNMAERLLEVTSEEITDGYGIVGGSMKSFEDHLHFVASDLETKSEADSDLKELNNWFLYRIEDGKPVSLIKHRKNGKIGAYLEELLI